MLVAQQKPRPPARATGAAVAIARSDTQTIAQICSIYWVITMAASASMNTSYELSNYEQLLGAVIKRSETEMNKPKGGAAALKARIIASVRAGNFIGEHQVRKPEPGRQMSIQELCDSYVHETTAQLIDAGAVEKILFGPDGLIRKAGGGRAPYLMEDIEVGYITDPVAGTSVGPVITSGRNRMLALQIMLRAAGLAPAAIAALKIRVSVIQVATAEELQRRIISANTGSRDFSSAEVRERMGAAGGLQLIDRDSIQATISMAKDEKAFKAAMGAWVKNAAMQAGLNGLTPAQYSNAGNSLWNQLAKKNRPEGRTFYAWVKEDTARFMQIASASDQALPTAVAAVMAQKSAGPLATKLANVLVPVVANRCGLNA